MNPFLPIVYILAVITIIMTGLSVFLVVYLLKQNKPHNKKANNHKFTSVYCKIHENLEATGKCAICEEPFCENCIKSYEHLRFCPEHFKLYNSSKWTPIAKYKSTPGKEIQGIYLYDKKQILWKEKSIPTFIETDYKIDVEKDVVESHFTLFVREEDKDYIRQQFQTKNPTSDII